MKGRPNLAAAVDVIIWHTYAYWSGQDISTAATLVESRWNDMLAAYPGKPMILGETGWPTMVDHNSPDGGVPMTSSPTRPTRRASSARRSRSSSRATCRLDLLGHRREVEGDVGRGRGRRPLGLLHVGAHAQAGRHRAPRMVK
jgi:hypothetical protein